MSSTQRGRRVPASRLPLRIAVVVAAVVLGACGTAAPSRSPASSPSSAAPGASGAPRTTPWPGNAVLGIEALGVSDSEIREAINDFGQGVANEDLPLMRRAADGLSRIDELSPNADKIDVFPPMQPLAARLREILPAIASSAAGLRDAIDAGDAAGIGTHSRDLAAALTQYAEIQGEIAAWVVQVPEQKRLFAR